MHTVKLSYIIHKLESLIYLIETLSENHDTKEVHDKIIELYNKLTKEN